MHAGGGRITVHVLVVGSPLSSSTTPVVVVVVLQCAHVLALG